MGVWNVVLIILAIINIAAFLSAVYVSYYNWKEERKKNWETPLMGFFFIPLCVFIALAWPIAKLRERRKAEKQKKEREKRMEVTKRYHFQSFAFRLKGLPFKPSSQEIIYVENEYNERINQIIKGNLEYIQERLDGSHYFKSRFVYLPNLIEELSHEESAIGYVAPYIKEKALSANFTLKSSSLLDYMAVPENRSKIGPCFARYCGEQSGCSFFECVGFDPDEGVDENNFLSFLCLAFDHFPQPVGPAFQTAKKKEEIQYDADARFDETYKQLMEEVEERISKLRKMGISQWALEQLVKPELKLSRLVVTKDMRLLLPDYNDMEIKMEPINKAVYLLFLRYPEGIVFKYLPDYRMELADIYQKIRPLGLNERAIQSIEDVTNPCLNSINEKCARIRGAFVSQFDEKLAQHYYIFGRRGEPKKIALPRDLVTWE